MKHKTIIMLWLITLFVIILGIYQLNQQNKSLYNKLEILIKTSMSESDSDIQQDNLTLVQHFNALFYDYEVTHKGEYSSFDEYINEYMYFE